jgi:hypothetical protein
MKTQDRIQDTKLEEKFNIVLTLETVDKAVLDWVKKDVNVIVSGESGEQIHVPVMMAVYEKWSKAAKGDTRDKLGKIIFPLVVVRRMSETLDTTRIVPLNPYTDITISTQLNGGISSRYLQSPNHPENIPVYDVYTLPYPNFVNITYNLHVFTKFMSHQNQIISEILDASKTSYKNIWLIGENYKYLGEIGNLSDQSNIDDFSEGERIFQKILPLTIHAYLLPSQKNRDYNVKHTRTFTRSDFTEELED